MDSLRPAARARGRARRDTARAVARAAAVTGVAAGIYAAVVRPRMLRWGATAEEVRRPYPGAGIVPDGTRAATMATTINAPPRQVWPWLVQMGTDRAGWYSWDRLDNFGRRSADRIFPEWQHIQVGDRLTATPDGSEWWEVAALDPGRFLALRMSLDLRGRPFDPDGARPRYFTDSTWCFLIHEVAGGRTRLVVSGYWAMRPRWLMNLLNVIALEPSHWVMQTRQFTNLKRRVAAQAPLTGPAQHTRRARAATHTW